MYVKTLLIFSLSILGLIKTFFFFNCAHFLSVLFHFIKYIDNRSVFFVIHPFIFFITSYYSLKLVVDDLICFIVGTTEVDCARNFNPIIYTL